MRAIISNVMYAFFILAFSVTTSLSALAAGDEGLYDPVPPEGAAFVRFIHADAVDASEVNPKLNGRTLDGVKFVDVKPYSIVMNGKVKAEFGKVSFEFDAEAKAHYSLIYQNSALRVVKDPEIADDLKAQIIVYNLTSKDDISVKTADGKVSVVGPLKAGEMLERAVNPIKVAFAAYSGETKYVDLSDIPLERKNSYVVAIMEQNGTGVATYQRATVAEE